MNKLIRIFKQLRNPLEFLLLGLLLFAVPSLEVPKNMLWIAYVMTWLVNRYHGQDLGGRWDAWDSLIAVWLASGYLVATFSSFHGSEWAGANDMLRYLSLLWLIKRSGYPPQQLILVPLLAVLGTLPPLMDGARLFFVTHENIYLELNSVGHVNHSAIYLAIACGAALSATVAWWGRLSLAMRISGAMLVLLLCLAVLISASRGAIGALFLLMFLQGVAWLRRSRKQAIVLLVIPFCLGGSGYLSNIEVLKKQERNIQSKNVLAFRDGIWNAALDTWRHAPMLGIGINNYKQIDLEKLQAWRAAGGRPFAATDYYMAPHAHSLYFNSLAERGGIGSAILLAALGYWLYSLLRHQPGRAGSDAEWALWGGALSAWSISVVAGLVNTTLHHEHAILSMVLLGAWLAYRKAVEQKISDRPPGLSVRRVFERVCAPPKRSLESPAFRPGTPPTALKCVVSTGVAFTMNESLNILLAVPTKTGRTKVGLNLGQALADLGHQISYFDYDDRSLLQRLTPKAMRGSGFSARRAAYVNRAVLKTAKRLKPNLFLCVKGLQFSPATIRRIGDAGTVTTGYWIDDPLDHARSLVNAPVYHHYFTNDRDSVARYRMEGIANICHLPSSASTAIFYPLPVLPPLADLTFIGTYSPYRECILAQLQDFDLRVYGPGWGKSALDKDKIYPEAFGALTNEIFNRSRINLNIHNWFGQGSAMNLRLFEVPAAGGFLLTDWVDEIAGTYQDGRHIACWRNVAELRDKIAYYLAHEAERLAIAQAGREHFLLHHSYATQAKFFLDTIYEGQKSHGALTESPNAGRGYHRHTTPGNS
jgi:spore maturation protein CgeB